MDMFFMIRRHKTTIFIDAKELSTVLELKRIIEGILNRPPEEQHLYKDDQLRHYNNMMLRECGFTSKMASPWDPATVRLALWVDGAFEDLHMEPYSNPEEEKMQEDAGSSNNEHAEP